jgi:hypothetical protein
MICIVLKGLSGSLEGEGYKRDRSTLQACFMASRAAKRLCMGPASGNKSVRNKFLVNMEKISDQV